MNSEIDNSKKNLFVERLQHEMNDVEKTTERYEYLKEINDKIFTENKKLDDILVEANNSVYLKKWNRLPIFHKIHKIQEYIDEKYDGDKKLKEKLVQMIKDDKLNSCKSIKYDSVTQKITKIIVSKSETY
jgi:hypothetical protein